jgi:hypothetical protein
LSKKNKRRLDLKLVEWAHWSAGNLASQREENLGNLLVDHSVGLRVAQLVSWRVDLMEFHLVVQMVARRDLKWDFRMVVLLVDQWVVLLVDSMVDLWVVLLVDLWVVLLVDLWVVDLKMLNLEEVRAAG